MRTRMWSIKVLQHETQRVRCLGKANGDKGTEQRTSQFYFSSIDFCLFSRSMFAPSLAHKQERSSMLALLGLLVCLLRVGYLQPTIFFLVQLLLLYQFQGAEVEARFQKKVAEYQYCRFLSILNRKMYNLDFRVKVVCLPSANFELTSVNLRWTIAKYSILSTPLFRSTM